MELFRQMVIHMLSGGEMVLSLPLDFAERLNHRCFAILDQIRKIVADDKLDDPECFHRIERIVCELEANGINCGARHDFG